MYIELTAKQKANLVDDLIHEASSEELKNLACKFIRAYANFLGADMNEIQKCVDRLTPGVRVLVRQPDASDFDSEEC